MRKTTLAAVALSALAAEAPAAGDVDAGEAVFRKCAVCHAVGEGARNKTGPQLNGVVGRAAGSVEGAQYSSALEDAGAAGLVWTAAELDAFLQGPRGYLKGTRMSFRGLPDAQDRADVIAYLAHFSESGEVIEATADVDTEAAEPGVSQEVLALEGDVAYGEYLSGECTTCHRADGADQGIPSITGWEEATFVIAMHDYKTKRREHPVMNMVAGRLGDDEIASLAAYFAGLKN